MTIERLLALLVLALALLAPHAALAALAGLSAAALALLAPHAGLVVLAGLLAGVPLAGACAAAWWLLRHRTVFTLGAARAGMP